MARNQRRGMGKSSAVPVEYQSEESTDEVRGIRRPQRGQRQVYQSKPRSARSVASPPKGSGIIYRPIAVSLTPPVRGAMSGLGGRTIETNPYGEPILNKNVRVVQIGYNHARMYCTSDTAVASPVKFFCQQLFPILQQKTLEKGKFVSGALASLDTFPLWIQSYMDLFLALRTLEGVLAGNGMSAGLTAMADAGGQFRVRLEQDLLRLASFPVPQGLVELLDRLSGIFMYDEASLAWVPVYDAQTFSNANVDLTLSNSWLTLLGDAELALTANLGAVSNADNANILSVLGTLYGIPTIGKKGVSFVPAECDQWQTQNVFWQDSNATAGAFGAPAVNLAASAAIPVLARVGRPTEPWEMSLLRPPVANFQASPYTKINPLVQYGLLDSYDTVSALVQFKVRFYLADGTTTTLTAGGAGPVQDQTTDGNIFTWWPEAETEGAGGPTHLIGQGADWDVYTSTVDVFMDETILQYTRIFELSN